MNKMSATKLWMLSEEQAAKWALIFPLSSVPLDVNAAEAEYVAAKLESMWFDDMQTNRPHVIPPECDAESVAGWRAVCRAALKARILARRMAS